MKCTKLLMHICAWQMKWWWAFLMYRKQRSLAVNKTVFSGIVASDVLDSLRVDSMGFYRPKAKYNSRSMLDDPYRADLGERATLCLSGRRVAPVPSFHPRCEASDKAGGNSSYVSFCDVAEFHKHAIPLARIQGPLP
eukprot:scaffold7475_cov36-Prasinocladus_malaysianus.AAC.1